MFVHPVLVWQYESSLAAPPQRNIMKQEFSFDVEAKQTIETKQTLSLRRLGGRDGGREGERDGSTGTIKPKRGIKKTLA